MSPYPGGKHGPGHFIPANGPGPNFPDNNNFSFINLAPVTRQEPSEGAIPLSMPVHQLNDLLIVAGHIGSNFTPIGWNNRMNVTAGGRIGFFWKIAASAADTLTIAANPDPERGRFLQGMTYRPNGVPAQLNSKVTSLGQTPDGGTFTRAGITADIGETDTLLVVASTKIGENYNGMPSPPEVNSVGPSFTFVSFSVETDWEPTVHRFSCLAWGVDAETNANAVADGSITANPVIWTLGSSASGSTSIRFNIP